MPSAPLQALLDLQHIDLDLDRHRHRRGALPEKQAAAVLDTRIGVLEADLSTVQILLQDIVAREQVFESDLAATEKRITDVNRRLYGGQVAASRDLQAMAADVKALEVRRSNLEDRVLEILDEREPLDRRIEDLSADLVEALIEKEALEATIHSLEAEIDAELAALAEEREERAAEVPVELTATYEQIRAHLGGVGAARLVGAQCQGCFLTLPSGEVDRIKYLPADAVVTCEDCGRILVRT